MNPRLTRDPRTEARRPLGPRRARCGLGPTLVSSLLVPSGSRRSLLLVAPAAPADPARRLDFGRGSEGLYFQLPTPSRTEPEGIPCLGRSEGRL